LEAAFLNELSRIADRRGMSLAALVSEVDAGREDKTNLSSALRVFVLEQIRAGR
jgi:predicted DNA-binding ribbon-helix-helix protein